MNTKFKTNQTASSKPADAAPRTLGFELAGFTTFELLTRAFLGKRNCV